MEGLTINANAINRVNQTVSQVYSRLGAGDALAYAHLRFEYGLISFAAGIAVYFGLPFEPKIFVLLAFAVSMVVFWALAQGRGVLPTTRLLTVWAAMGLTWAGIHTWSVAAPILPSYHKAYNVEGWVDDVGGNQQTQQLYIAVASLDGKDTGIPKRVRIRAKPGDALPGDTVRLRAVMTGPMIPVLAGGYDPGRRFYFQRIGGMGFITGDAEVLPDQAMNWRENWRRRVVRKRFSLSAHIQSRAPPHTAGLQSALLTGDRTGIPEDQEDSLRDAGLAHLLAISGLHMGLLAGGSYFVVSLLLALVGPLARRYDMRKFAAIAGIITASLYLILSGASVSTQRAYVMAVIIFIAVILNRRAVSMRSVAVAAAITLIIHPEALMSAGFHMSFAATAALVAVFRYWADRRQYPRRTGFIARMWRNFMGLTTTSVVAGSATGGFAALHFNRFAQLGFVTNLLAMPIFTAVVMPAGFFALLFMPLGLDKVFLYVMGVGLEGVLFFSDKISAHPKALLHVKGANGFIIGLFGLGFALLCIGPRPVRLAGLATLLVSILMWKNIQPAQLRVSEDGRIAFWDKDAANILRVDRVRGDGFGRMQFIEQAGQVGAEMLPYFDTAAKCDSVGCELEIERQTVSLISEPDGLVAACARSVLVVLIQSEAGPLVRRNCQAEILDTSDMRKSGAFDVTIRGKGDRVRVTLTPANPKSRQRRPWGHTGRR